MKLEWFLRRKKCFWNRVGGALLTRRSLCNVYAFCKSQSGSWLSGYINHDILLQLAVTCVTLRQSWILGRSSSLHIVPLCKSDQERIGVWLERPTELCKLLSKILWLLKVHWPISVSNTALSSWLCPLFSTVIHHLWHGKNMLLSG